MQGRKLTTAAATKGDLIIEKVWTGLEGRSALRDWMAHALKQTPVALSASVPQSMAMVSWGIFHRSS